MFKKRSLIISEELHKEIKLHCALVAIPINTFVEYAISKELKHIEAKREEKA